MSSKYPNMSVEFKTVINGREYREQITVNLNENVSHLNEHLQGNTGRKIKEAMFKAILESKNLAKPGQKIKRQYADGTTEILTVKHIWPVTNDSYEVRFVEYDKYAVQYLGEDALRNIV